MEDLIIAAGVLDIGAVLLALDQGITDPMLYVGPVALSAMICAQLLRDTIDPKFTQGIRVASMLCVYLTGFAQVVVDPQATLTLLVLSLAGVALGGLLRIRVYLYLGASFLAATLTTNLVRFGIEHSHFWALYLTVLGLGVLGFMVMWTLQRGRFANWRSVFVTHLAAWD